MQSDTFYMKHLFTVLALWSFSASSHASFISNFKNPDGTTRWQYVANFSSGVLIITLLILTLVLLFIARRVVRANRELKDIKATLEERVATRTQSLKETTAHLQDREQYITSIIESMPLMLIGLNNKMEINQWNSVAESSTGRPASSVMGKRLWDAYPAITLTPEQVSKVLTNKETVTIKHSQRDQYYFDLTLYTVTDKGETGVVILVDDVTKQMKAENKVAERDKVSAMGELASAMAYDVNLPLQTISSSLHQAEQKICAESVSEANQALVTTLKNAQLSSNQASAIIQNLLDLANSHQQEKQQANVSAIMDRSIALAGQLFSDFQGLSFDKINITRHYQPELPQILCYTAELEQVFIRLLRNAFHALNHSGQANPYIKVEVSDFYDSLWIKVHHNGRVLNEQEQEDIFQSYFSLNSRPAACPVEQRLSYSYFIITNHHQGQMSVTSSEKFGTTFNIQLPLA